jgi:hypothetical protein
VPEAELIAGAVCAVLVVAVGKWMQRRREVAAAS